MIEKENLKKWANKLMFDMDDKEYETLQEELSAADRRGPDHFAALRGGPDDGSRCRSAGRPGA